MSKPNAVFKDAYNRCLALLQQGDALGSEPAIAERLAVSRTTVRAVLARLRDQGVVDQDQRDKRVLRRPSAEDFFAADETDSVADLIERRFLRRVFVSGVKAGDQISERDFAREIGVSTSAVREYLIRFSRFGLIEKRRNSQWVFKGFNRRFATELTEVREMFELRSAQAFVQLPPEHPAWTALAALRVEHEVLLDTVETGYLAFSELDERFHRLIHAASDNRFIIQFHDVIALIFHYHYQWNTITRKARNMVALREHLDYIDALMTRQELEALFFCKRHLRSARQTLLRSIE